MAKLELIIGNKNYSSWSMRPWLVLTHFDVPFRERMVLLNDENFTDTMRRFGPLAQVPVLVDGETIVWDSLAIIEYVAESHPDRAIWPEDRAARAHARALAASMHGGFSALRNAAPVNLRRTDLRGFGHVAESRADVETIQTLWLEALENSGGPFLFGSFSAADAMYAPVVTRLNTYGYQVTDRIGTYMDKITDLPAFTVWCADASTEPWVVPIDEVDDGPSASDLPAS